ncbi:hypothetical protein BX600DRAFT_519523 [Xylariales sp. PMI_506]|nr:hypothetical protein BX600DRAFT_519523 [Xylariales sp. PMI_506]
MFLPKMFFILQVAGLGLSHHVPPYASREAKNLLSKSIATSTTPHYTPFNATPPHQQVFCRNESDPPIYTWGDVDTGGPGVVLVNYDPLPHEPINGTMFFLYESNHDYVPYKYIALAPYESAFIQLCPTFEGRIVRGSSINLDGQKHLLGTWAEINWFNGISWGDISLLEGNDGPVIIQSLDGINKIKGFVVDVITNAPPGTLAQKSTGSWCLDMIVGPTGNNITKRWEETYLDPGNVYLENNINPVIDSANGRFEITFYQGII